MGIPFDFASSPQKPTPTVPKPVTRVHAIKERAALEIVFPRVSGYRRDLPSEKLEAVFTEDSRLEITPADIGPTSVVMEGAPVEASVLTAQTAELVAFFAVQPISSVAAIGISLLHPAVDRRRARLELTGQVLNVPAGARQRNYLLPELRWIRVLVPA